MAGADVVVIEVDTYATYMSAKYPLRFVSWFLMPVHYVVPCKEEPQGKASERRLSNEEHIQQLTHLCGWCCRVVIVVVQFFGCL